MTISYLYMNIFDTHCHYNLEPLYISETPAYEEVENYDGISDVDRYTWQPTLDSSKRSGYRQIWKDEWDKAQAHNVKKSVVVGTTLESSQTALTISMQDENLYASIGIHPHEYSEVIQIADTLKHLKDIPNLYKTDKKLRSLYKMSHELHSKVVAIGETGLDFFRMGKFAYLPKCLQVYGFIEHIKLADKLKLPLILHVRDDDLSENKNSAYWYTLTMLKRYKQNNLPFILHCVSGPEKYVQEALAMGAYVSVAGNVTYKNADHIRTLASLVPSDKLLLETDAPFLPPQQYRGKQCEPWMISLTANYLQNELKRDLEQIYENSLKVFNLS